MTINPCCCRDLQRGSKIVAIVEIVYYTLVLLVVVGITIFVTVSRVKNGGDMDGENHNATTSANTPTGGGGSGTGPTGAWVVFLVVLLAIVWVGIYFAVPIVGIILGVYLLKALKNKEAKKVKAWLIFRGLMLCPGIFFSCVFWEILVAPFLIWVVFSYMKQLKKESYKGQGVGFSQPQQEKV